MKFLQLFTLLLCMVFIISCGNDDCNGMVCQNNGECVEGLCDCPEGFAGDDCSISCNSVIFGTWNVTDIRPVGCTLLTYTFGTGPSATIFSMTLDDGDRVLTGNGLIDSDCKELTYSVSNGSTIVSGTIIFDGSTLEDRSGLGCLIYADKQ